MSRCMECNSSFCGGECKYVDTNALIGQENALNRIADALEELVLLKKKELKE